MVNLLILAVHRTWYWLCVGTKMKRGAKVGARHPPVPIPLGFQLPSSRAMKGLRYARAQVFMIDLFSHVFLSFDIFFVLQALPAISRSLVNEAWMMILNASVKGKNCHTLLHNAENCNTLQHTATHASSMATSSSATASASNLSDDISRPVKRAKKEQDGLGSSSRNLRGPHTNAVLGLNPGQGETECSSTAKDEVEPTLDEELQAAIALSLKRE